jgi:hypothetical protein
MYVEYVFQIDYKLYMNIYRSSVGVMGNPGHRTQRVRTRQQKRLCYLTCNYYVAETMAALVHLKPLYQSGHKRTFETDHHVFNMSNKWSP